MEVNRIKQSIGDMNKLIEDLMSTDLGVGLNRFEEVLGITAKVIVDAQSSYSNELDNIQFFDSLVVKFLDHSVSISHILKPMSKYEDSKLFISSIYTLARSQFEAYLMLVYLYFEKKTDEEKELRFLVYEYSGLSRRLKHKPNDNLLLAKYEKELLDLKDLKIRMEKNIVFKSFSPGRQREILKGNSSKLNSTADIINKSEFFKDKSFGKLWNLQSNFAHAEYISVIQIFHYMRNDKDAVVEMKRSLKDICILCGALSFDLINNLNEVKNSHELLERKELNVIAMYKSLATTEPPSFVGY